MKIDHIAIWTSNLERLKEFYTTYFKGKAGNKYTNFNTHFESYFIKFSDGAHLELMYRPDIPTNHNDELKQHLGIIHIAFEVANRQSVDEMARTMAAGGFPILKGPRTTGDGYYEFETQDPDGNRIEVVAK